MAFTFPQWLGDCLDAMDLNDLGRLMQDRTLIVRDIICTFVHPCGDSHDLAAILLDTGIVLSADKYDVVGLALSRNLENFLLGAPLFFVNPSSQHLVLGQKFEFEQIAASTFAPLLDALALQAKAWRDRGEPAR
ncbi:hypothetical protein [Bradyrhizobium sp. SBR1B]|uniref:hypothetical protein n=1 Tax=Bradyrhizobium sp. SBR1B TaxID=2663836 RepID=UPI00160584DD|nr:hypothetical protein [Bradyrhizobium sp. SBR1B]MBB4383383.1 hypothetical protein [Bradyrhizobium sp. SBR1B]